MAEPAALASPARVQRAGGAHKQSVVAPRAYMPYVHARRQPDALWGTNPIEARVVRRVRAGQQLQPALEELVAPPPEDAPVLAHSNRMGFSCTHVHDADTLAARVDEGVPRRVHSSHSHLVEGGRMARGTKGPELAGRGQCEGLVPSGGHLHNVLVGELSHG